MKPDNDDSLPRKTGPGQAARIHPKVRGKLLITKHISRVYGRGLAFEDAPMTKKVAIDL